MAVSVSAAEPCGHGTKWERGLAASREGITPHNKDQNSKLELYFLLNVYCFLATVTSKKNVSLAIRSHGFSAYRCIFIRTDTHLGPADKH